MKTHTTNYQDVFIEIADDCPAVKGVIPPVKTSGKTVANVQFEMLNSNPYKFTSDDVLFHVFADKNNLPETEYVEMREQFFSKGQPCFRASPLTKRYGWGVHSNNEGKIAIYGCETEDYKNLSTDKNLKVIKAMRTNR